MADRRQGHNLTLYPEDNRLTDKDRQNMQGPRQD